MEKRKIKRIRKRIMVKIDNRPAILIDISRGGIKLSSAIVPSNPEVNIEINDNNRIFKLKGTIRWITRKVTFQNLKEIGIQIKDAPEEFNRYIEELGG